jgi:hypothetical protein
MLISAKPDSKGKEAALFRCRQLTEFRWTPVGDIPIFTKMTGKTKLPAGVEQKGMIYSSTEVNDKFIAENVSFETLLSVIANPDSALYHKDVNGHGNSWAYFGIVCNGLVRYALDIAPRYSTKRWMDIPGMSKIAEAECYDAERIELCDILLECEKIKHVLLITDILRDETGTIQQIEVSEAVRPTCVRNQYDIETFFEKYRDFSLWRYDFIDAVPQADPQQAACLLQGVPSLPSVAVDYGNKSNYRASEDVVISSFVDGKNEVEIYRGDELVETIFFNGSGKVSRKFDRGYYRVKHKTANEIVEFCVTSPQISQTVKDGMLTVQADPCDPESKILYVDFRERSKGELATIEKDYENNAVAFYSTDAATLSKVEELTEEEKKTGSFTRKIPNDAVNFKVYFENKYGIWTHTMIRIDANS